ncbi:hypothetical protein MY04_4726 [Flammeovirga sp. MY04]|uniref:lipopolysaccharide biosynthesis protein n=1 Tax=Flammeovirga sp. MY04 TaxID=1191459 RepID=UPI0008061F7F|nr:hypothetical protein [Flammeovirga sp. MY04]ANQ52061.1 hypothetical protein MY04_4726 [Flammeovirga sp. MY04]
MKRFIALFKEKPFISSLSLTFSELLYNYSLLLFVTQVYSAEDVGRWFIFFAVFNLSINIREGVLYVALVKFSSGKEDETAHSTYKTVLYALLLIESLIGAVIFAIGYYDFFPEVSALLLFYPLYSISNNCLKWIENIHKSRGELYKAVMINFTTLLMLFTAFFYFSNYPVELSNLIIYLSGLYFVSFLIGLSSIPTFKIVISKFNKKTFKHIMHYAKQGTLKAIFGTLASRMTLFISAGILSLEVTALLGVAQRYLVLILSLSNAIQLIFYPKIVLLFEQGNLRHFKLEFTKTIKRVYTLIVPISIAFLIVIKPLLGILHGEGYGESFHLLVILIMSAQFSPLGAFFGSYTNAIGKPQYSTNVVVINSCILIFSSYFFVKFFGELGTVLPLLVTEIIGFFIIYNYYQKYERINIILLMLRTPKLYLIYFRRAKQLYHLKFKKTS